MSYPPHSKAESPEVRNDDEALALRMSMICLFSGGVDGELCSVMVDVCVEGERNEEASTGL